MAADHDEFGGARLLICPPEWPRMAAAAIREQARSEVAAACRRHDAIPLEVNAETNTPERVTLVLTFPGGAVERIEVQVLAEGRPN
ncbi:hypothetical protein K3217_05300 [bacterium BD-1]|nr:hypothetical protein [Ottowia caeni]